MTADRRRVEALAVPPMDAAYKLARWLTGSPAEAEDVVQDAMLRAFKGFDGFRGEDAKPWLMAIVRNCWRNRAVDGRRHAHAPLPSDDERPVVAEGPDPET